MVFTYRFLNRETVSIDVSSELSALLEEMDHEEHLSDRRYKAHNASLSAFPDAEEYFPDTEYDLPSEVFQHIDIQKLKDLLKRLPPQQLSLLRRIYWDEDKLVQIAEEMGVSYQAIQNRQNRILQKFPVKWGCDRLFPPLVSRGNHFLTHTKEEKPMKNMPLNDRQRSLVENHLRLLPHILHTIPLYCFDSWDDAYQTGAIGLIKAARHFDEQKGVQFATFASACILNELRMGMRRNRTRTRLLTVSADAPFSGSSEDTTCTLVDTLLSAQLSPEEQCVLQETLSEVCHILSSIKDKTILSILQMTLAECRQADIASAVGCTQSNVSRKLQRIRQRLRASIEA